VAKLDGAVASEYFADLCGGRVGDERAEESLAGVLARRRLSERETEEMLAPVLAALEYLHRNGYAHGRIKPSNVLAVGETVRLSADSVASADDAARAEDVYAVGHVVKESATVVSPALAEIVQHALEPDPARRWTTPQMQSRLSAPEGGEETTQSAVPGSGGPKWGVPKWIIAALAALVLIVVGLSMMRRKEPAPAAVVPAREPVVASRAPDVPRAVSRSNAPPVSTGHGTTGHKTTGPGTTGLGTTVPGRRASGWSVIVAAYGFRAPAEKRLGAMEAKWGRFQWSVLEQRADKTYYLVVIGQNLSEDDAEALRKRAVQAGLPRDTYIKRVP
jgi:hypothetical protein